MSAVTSAVSQQLSALASKPASITQESVSTIIMALDKISGTSDATSSKAIMSTYSNIASSITTASGFESFVTGLQKADAAATTTTVETT